MTDVHDQLPEAMQQFLELAAPLRQEHPDFEDVVNTPVFTPEMRDVLFSSDQGPAVAYYLGRNAEEAKRIGGLAPEAMHRELGRLEGQFSVPEVASRKISQAPEPISPLTGTAGAPTTDPDKMTTEQFMQWDRQRQIAKMKTNPF